MTAAHPDTAHTIELMMGDIRIKISNSANPRSAYNDIPDVEGAVMLADISGVDAVYIVCGRTDMRKSIDGLCTHHTGTVPYGYRPCTIPLLRPQMRPYQSYSEGTGRHRP